MTQNDDAKAPRRRVFEQLTFVRHGRRIEIAKQTGQKRYHLSWTNPDELEREIGAFLECQKRHISLADLLGQVAGEDTENKVRLPGPKGEVAFADFCRKVLPQYRNRFAGWSREEDRVNWVLAKAPFAGRSMHAISPREIADFYHEYERRPEVTSDNTRAHMVKALRAIFRTAAEIGYLREDPSSGLKMPGVPETNRRDLSVEEARRLYRAADSRTRRWILLALYTGLRPGEIAHLRASNVNVGDRRINIFGRTVKNRTRSIHVHDDLVNVLLDCASTISNVPLLRTGTGEPESFPRKGFDRARRAAGLEDIDFYTLRHTFATWLLETGTRDEETRAYLLGHRLSRMSARYTHITFDMIRKAIERLPSVTGLASGNEREAAG